MRPSALAACAVALLNTIACYEYRPLTAPPAAGETVALEITDQGRVNLAGRFGPGLAEVQGRLVARPENEYVLSVYRVSQLSGESSAWSGETTHLDRGFIGTVKGRQFSPLRSGLLTLIAAGAGYFLVSRNLFGSFSGGHDPVPDEPPLSQRRPARVPLRLRF